MFLLISAVSDSILRTPECPILLTVRPNCSSGARCLLPAGSQPAILESSMLSFIGLWRKGTCFPKDSGDAFHSVLSLLGDHVDNYIFHVSRDPLERFVCSPKAKA